MRYGSELRTASWIVDSTRSRSASIVASESNGDRRRASNTLRRLAGHAFSRSVRAPAICQRLLEGQADAFHPHDLVAVLPDERVAGEPLLRIEPSWSVHEEEVLVA